MFNETIRKRVKAKRRSISLGVVDNGFFGIVSAYLPPELFPLVVWNFDILSLVTFSRVSKRCRTFLLESIDVYGLLINYFAKKGLPFEGIDFCYIVQKHEQFHRLNNDNIHKIYNENYRNRFTGKQSFGSERDLVMFNTIVIGCVLKIACYDEACVLYATSGVAEARFYGEGFFVGHPRSLLFPLEEIPYANTILKNALVILYNRDLQTVVEVSLRNGYTIKEKDKLRYSCCETEDVIILVSEKLCTLFEQTPIEDRIPRVQHWLRRWRHIRYVTAALVPEFQVALRSFCRVCVDKPKEKGAIFLD